MRFLTMIKSDENRDFGPPPPALFEAIEKLAEEQTAAGTLITRGGLAPTVDGVQIRMSGGKLTMTDGPFTEAKEVIGGFAMHEVRTRDEAVEMLRRVMQIHAEIWPEFEGTCELRQVFTTDEEFGLPQA
jgi:hypothetical protein